MAENDYVIGLGGAYDVVNVFVDCLLDVHKSFDALESEEVNLDEDVCWWII